MPTRGAAVALLCAAVVAGCEKPEPIVTYTVPTQVPVQLQVGKERMLAAIVPKGEQVWFFKVTGPEQAVDEIESELRGFVRTIEFDDDAPVLSSLPEGWRLGGEKPMRFATIDVETPGKQLNISISKLGRQADWDEQVAMNVNRWRGQLGLSPSKAKWADGEGIQIAAADASGVWVDLLGEPSSGNSSMSPPFAGSGLDGPVFDGPGFDGPGFDGPGFDGPGFDGQSADQAPPTSATAAPPVEPDPRLKYKRPEGWRDGRMTSMRMAAFSIGPEDSPAELTVIPAGGDLRGNVARWLGQVREGDVPDEVVDKALDDATMVDVDGRTGQRFLLTGVDATQGTAIDATIVPLDGGISLFVKMTGPAETVAEQSDAIASFLKSLELNL